MEFFCSFHAGINIYLESTILTYLGINSAVANAKIREDRIKSRQNLFAPVLMT